MDYNLFEYAFEISVKEKCSFITQIHDLIIGFRSLDLDNSIWTKKLKSVLEFQVLPPNATTGEFNEQQHCLVTLRCKSHILNKKTPQSPRGNSEWCLIEYSRWGL